MFMQLSSSSKTAIQKNQSFFGVCEQTQVQSFLCGLGLCHHLNHNPKIDGSLLLKEAVEEMLA
jgi:hypothetical protein